MKLRMCTQICSAHVSHKWRTKVGRVLSRLLLILGIPNMNVPPGRYDDLLVRRWLCLEDITNYYTVFVFL